MAETGGGDDSWLLDLPDWVRRTVYIRPFSYAHVRGDGMGPGDICFGDGYPESTVGIDDASRWDTR